MTDLPPGWEWTTLGEVAESVKNGIYVSRPGVEPDGVPILRISAVRPLALSVDDLRYSARTADDLESADALVEGGDLLFTRYSGSRDFVGVCARAPDGLGELTYPDKLIRVRLPPGIDSKYVAYAFTSPGVRSRVEAVLRTTAGQVGVAGRELKRVQFPLAPLAEQRRIVDSLEEYLPLLDTGVAGLDAALRRTRSLVKRVIITALPTSVPPGWTITTVGEAGEVSLGRQRHPDWHSGDHMRPYLRVANVFEDRIDIRDLMQMDFPPDVFNKFCLASGDILLNEGQSPEYLGRPAMYRGEPPEVAFTNSLIRFRAGSGVDPEWALLVFRRHMHAGRFLREVRITTNIAHLSAGRFKAVEFPVPPLDEQRRIVVAVKGLLDDVVRFIVDLEVARKRASFLRWSLLSDAFAGRFVPQNPKDEPASALLDRIRTERDNTDPTGRKHRVPTLSATRSKRGGAGGC